MILDLIVCAVGWIIIACHTWSLKYHFDMPVTPPGVRLISSLVIFSAIVLTFLVFHFEQPVWTQIVGLLMLIISFVMFWITIRESSNAKLLAAFDEKLPHGLLKTGPYAYVRHPFYTSYLIQWIGWAIASWSVWGIVPVVFMTTTYYVAATGEENKFAKTGMSDEYAAYMARTGKFFPKLFPTKR
ncbi:MAG: isoprenylcysteine carboxylmethyltransferase family protein [Pseudomonadota bacterium]